MNAIEAMELVIPRHQYEPHPDGGCKVCAYPLGDDVHIRKMNAIKHTPAPWKILHTPTRKETFWSVVTSGGAPIHAVICMVDAKSKAHQENPGMDEANARLIAAAPDLLRALIELVERAESEGHIEGLPEYDQAKAAIAKASDFR